jgi:hypothetical protein
MSSLNGIALRGANVQTVNIGYTGPIGCTGITGTLINMGNNCRVEDITGTIWGPTGGTGTIVGVNYPDGTSITSKLRTTVINAINPYNNSTNVYGILSGGISSTVYSSSNAIRATTVNVYTAGTGKTRGVLVNNTNRFTVRDTNIYAGITGNLSYPSMDIIGCEVNDPGATGILELRSSTIFGYTGATAGLTGCDISQTSGQIILASTDLYNETANGNSFTVTVAPQTTYMGLYGTSFAVSTTYNLAPGMVSINSAISSTIPIYFNKTTLINGLSITINGSFTGTVEYNIYKNGGIIYTISRNANGAYTDNSKSFRFTTTDYFYATMTTGSGTDYSSITSIITSFTTY